MTNFRVKIIFSGFVALALTGCGGEKKSDTEGKPRIVATTTMLADMARQIAGDHAEVVGLMAAGVDPHSYELPARAIGQLKSADLVIYNGMFLEGKMDEIVAGLKESGVSIFTAVSAVPAEKLITAEQIGEEHGDPHIWGDADLWAEVVPGVGEEISNLFSDEKSKAAIQKRADQYREKIVALDAWIEKRIAEVPREKRLLVTSHDAFNYLGRAYEIDVVGVQGISTATDAGIADITSTVDLIKKRGVTAIFVENSVDPSIIERISQDSGAKIGGELFSDSTGPAGEMKTVNDETYDVGTYVGMTKHNINTIVEALK